MSKLAALRSILYDYQGALLAFSGGVDSTLLAAVARECLGDNLLAVTAASPIHPVREGKAARELASNLGLRHLIIEADELAQADFIANGPARCYHCKLALFQKLKRLAAEHGLNVVMDGSNHDDLADYRPGSRALQELGVCSPLREAGLTKAEIRQLSKEMNLPTWDQPAYACLATRIPYGQAIKEEALARIDQAETALLNLGFREVRVRDHHPVARIEVGREEMEKAWSQRAAIATAVRECGYAYVTLDLAGFRSGSMNEVL